jgi:hypothetical protein
MLFAARSGLGGELVARRNVYVTARDQEIMRSREAGLPTSSTSPYLA